MCKALTVFFFCEVASTCVVDMEDVCMCVFVCMRVCVREGVCV